MKRQCTGCRSTRALARVGEAILCESCLVTDLNRRGLVNAGLTTRFFHALVQPGPKAVTNLAEMPKTDAQIRCGLCGLTFAEFETYGRAGCGECYSVFRPSVSYALSVLHGSVPAS